MDTKRLVTASYTLYDVACYEYRCGKCGDVDLLPQIVIKGLNLLAPEGWACVVQDNDRSYYCAECADEIGI